MISRNHKIQPFQTSDQNRNLLLDFAVSHIRRLVPDFDLSGEWQETAQDIEPWVYEHYEYFRGNDTHGFRAVVRGELEPKASGRAVDIVKLDAEGLPDGMSFSMECTRSWLEPRFISIAVSGQDDAVNAIIGSFEETFSQPRQLGDFELQSELTTAVIAVRVGQWDSARLRMEYVLKQNPDQPKALWLLGAAYAGLDRLDEAEDCMERSLVINPDDEDACYNLGLFHLLKRGSPQEAISAFRRGLDISPNNHALIFQLACALEADGKPGDALDAYRKVIETSPNPKEAWAYSGLDFTGQARDAIERLDT